MTLPPEVKVGPYVYQIIIVDEHVPASDGRGWSVGQIDYPALTITVMKAAPGYMYGTFIHELMHAAADMAGVSLEEAEVQALGNVWTGLLLDNDFLGVE